MGERRLRPIPGTTLATRVSVDDAIAHVERLIEGGKVEGFVTVARVRRAPGVLAIEMIPLETNLVEAREALEVVLEAINEMIGEGS